MKKLGPVLLVLTGIGWTVTALELITVRHELERRPARPRPLPDVPVAERCHGVIEDGEIKITGCRRLTLRELDEVQEVPLWVR